MSVKIREATDDDLEITMAWRSNPLIFAGFYLQNEPLMWEGHFAWWKSRTNRIDWIIVLGEGGDSRDVGSVNVSSLDIDTPEVGVYIGEVTLWGRGIGRWAVSLAMDRLEEAGYKKARAFILKDNLASIKLFKALGFILTGEGRKGEWIYEIDIHGRLQK